MSHIVEFSIDSLAGRKGNYSQKLNEDVNIFFGLNGSGKTSLMRILSSAMEGNASSLRLVPFESAKVKIHSITYNRNFVRSTERKSRMSKARVKEKEVETSSVVESTVDEDIAEDEYIFSTEEEGLKWNTKPKKPDTSSVHWQHIYLPTWRLYVGNEPFSETRARPSVRYSKREEDWDRFFGGKLEELWAKCSNTILSEVKSVQEVGLASIMRRILAKRPSRKKIPEQMDIETVYRRVYAFLERQNSQDALGSISEFIDRYINDERIRSIVSEIDMTEQRIEKVMTARRNLERLITDMFTGNKTVVFSDTGIDIKTDEGKNISLASMSSGEKHVLWIFIEAILAGESTLIIDEPELSMHVDWQKMLVKAIRQLNPQAQLILATHSPEIMAETDDSKIFRLRYSFASYRRRMQMSRNSAFVFVEGHLIDRYFYGTIADSECGDNEVVAGEELGGETGDKELLLKFFDYLRKKNSLVDAFKGKTTISIFYLDKDIDDLLRKKRRSEHVIYTEPYELENYLFIHGDIKTAAATAALIDPASIRQYFGSQDDWRRQAATKWKDWVILCLFSHCHEVSSICNYGRPISPINDGVYGPVKVNEFTNHISNLESNCGMSASKFSRCFANLTRRVEEVYRQGQYDRIFKGKWYLSFLAADIKRIAGRRRYRSRYIEQTLLTGLLQTMNLNEEWAEYFKKPLRTLLAKAAI